MNNQGNHWQNNNTQTESGITGKDSVGSQRPQNQSSSNARKSKAKES
jgi:hypothetical protein